MQKSLIKFTLIVLAWISYSCKNSDVKERGVKLPSLELTLVDKINLFNDSLAFSYYNLEKISSDSVLAFQHPLLNLSLLDAKGNFIKEISRRGNLKENFSTEFITPVWGEDGMLYVVEEGSSTKLTIFDKELNYSNSINLSRYLDGYYVVPLISSATIEVNPEKEHSIKLSITIGSTIYGVNDPAFYEEMSAIADIFIENSAVERVVLNAPMLENLNIKENLSKNQRNWSYITPIHVSIDKRNYLKYRFDDDVYIYDENWFLLEVVKIGNQYEYPTFAAELSEIEDISAKTEVEYKLKYLNRLHQSMYIKNRKIYLLYNKPPEITSKIPKTFNEDWDYYPQMVLHVKDLENENEYICELPETISPWGEIYVDDDSRIYLMDNQKKGEELYINVFEAIF